MVELKQNASNETALSFQCIENGVQRASSRLDGTYLSSSTPRHNFCTTLSFLLICHIIK
jgi:hypothetical protein